MYFCNRINTPKLKMTSTIKRITFGLFGIAVATTMLTSCLKDGTYTIVLPLPDGKIPYDVISEDLQDSLDRYGFEIDTGITPPYINGHYLASPMLLDYASDNVVFDFADVDMTFSKQLERGLIKYVETQNTPNYGSMTSVYENANIIGSGDKFTMYCSQSDNGDNTDNNDWNVKTTTVISGTWVDGVGIKDCQYAVIIQQKVYDSGNRIPEDTTITFRIFHDGDGMAEKLTAK